MNGRLAVRGIAVLALLSLLLWAGTTRAAGPRVLVISTGGGDPVTAHLLDELVALGMTVEVTPALDGDLATLARAHDAGAVLRVAPSRAAVDLWVDPGEGAAPAPLQRVEQDRAERGDPAAALALRAVELVRGRLLRVASTTRPPARPGSGSPAPPGSAPVAQASAPVPAPAPRATDSAGATAAPESAADSDGEPPLPTPAPRGRVSLYVMPSVVVHPGSGLSSSGAVLGGVRWMLSRRAGGDLLALFSVVPAVVEAPEGKARISGFAIGVGAWLDLLGPSLPITSGAGAGVALGVMSYDASPDPARPDLEGQQGSIAYALPYGRWSLEWRALPPLSLRADVLVGIAAPRPVVELGEGREDAYFGRPLLGFGLGIGMTIPWSVTRRAVTRKLSRPRPAGALLERLP